MKSRFSFKKILILVSILAVPGFLYYLLQEKGQNRYRPLSIFGPKEVASTFHMKRGKKIPDTIYHQVRDFKLLNQNGDSVEFKADTAKITIVNLFYSRCTGNCPQIMSEVARVAREYQKNRMVRFLSISVDPDYDNTERLSNYANKLEAEPPKWNLATGSEDLIYRLAKEDFLVDVVRRDSVIVHSPMLILVDPKKRIRGYYDGGNKEQVDKLIDEVKVQIAEELRKVTDL